MPAALGPDAGERQAMSAVLQLVLQGTDAIAADRKDSLAGAAKEGALLAALRLLRTAMQLDGEVLSVLRTTHRNGDPPRPRAYSSAVQFRIWSFRV